MGRDIKTKAVVEIKTSNISTSLNDMAFIRAIHRRIPRKLMVSRILDTAIPDGQDTAYCTVELEPAAMVSLDEIKMFLNDNSERVHLKTFVKWLESLEQEYKNSQEQ